MGPSDTEHGKRRPPALTAHTPTQTNCEAHLIRDVLKLEKRAKLSKIVLEKRTGLAEIVLE